MQLAGDLEHLGGLVRLLYWGVSDCLADPGLRSKAASNLLGDIVDQGPAVNIGIGIKEALLHALLDDLPDCGLRQRPKIDLS